MFSLVIASVLVLSCFSINVLSSPLSSSVECYSAPLPPIQECKAVLASMDVSWRHGPNLPRTWGRYEQTNETHVRVPVGYYLRHMGHSRQINKCEFRIDVRSDRPRATDIFTLQQLTLAAKRTIDVCYPKSGYSYPTQAGNVFVTPRDRTRVGSDAGIVLQEFNDSGLSIDQYEYLDSPEVIVDASDTRTRTA